MLASSWFNVVPTSSGVGVSSTSGTAAAGVTLEGLYYPLHEAVLTSAFPLGVSNQFTGVPASVTVRDGTLLVMWQEAAQSVVERL